MIPFLFEIECIGSEIAHIGETCSEASLLQELGKSIRLVKQMHIETEHDMIVPPINSMPGFHLSLWLIILNACILFLYGNLANLA
jgi:hypothetical protein